MVLRPDLLQHPDDLLVGPTVEGPVERRRGGGRADVRVRVRAPDDPHRVAAAVLLVVGVQDKKRLEGLCEHRVRSVPSGPGRPVHHGQEVLGVGEVVAGVDVRQSDRMPVGERRDGRDLRDQPIRLLIAGVLVGDVLGLRVERRERGEGAHQHAHRVSIVMEPVHELLDVLVDHRMEGDVVQPLLELGLAGQVPVDEEVGDLEVRFRGGELLDRIPAVAEDPLVAVDVRDRASAGGGVRERRVVAQDPVVVRPGADLMQVRSTDRPVLDRDPVVRSRPLIRDR